MSNDLMMCGYVVRTAAKDIRCGVPLARCHVWLVGFVFRAGEGRRWYRW
jgi:hypothetical protein